MAEAYMTGQLILHCVDEAQAQELLPLYTPPEGAQSAGVIEVQVDGAEITLTFDTQSG